MKCRALFFSLSLVLLSACGSDPVAPPTNNGSGTFLALTTRDAVVNNLEVAWNQRREDKIDELLDDNFTFFFAPGDVGQGLPASWGRADEMATTTGLFESKTAQNPTGPVCKSIHFNIQFEEIQWDDVPVPASAFGEVWSKATLFYTATFEMEPDNTYIMVPGAQIEVTVRPEGNEWRLVQLRDLAGSTVAKPNVAAASQEATWGAIKAVYYDGPGAVSEISGTTWGGVKALYR